AALGAALGVGVGVGYAWLMLTGLNTWWVDAVASPFVRLYVTPTSLLAGYFISVIMAWLTIVWSLRRIRKIEIRQLLAGETAPAVGATKPGRWSARFAWGALAVAVALVVPAARLSGEAQAGAFMGSGALVLTGFLLLFWRRLAQPVAKGATKLSIARLA